MDEILVKKTLSGDKTAFNQLVAKYQTQVYGLAFNMSRNFSDAEDLAQEAFLRAYLSLHQLREPAKFGNWLYRITQNVCRRWLQKKMNHEEMTERVKMNEMDRRVPMPDELTEARELQEGVRSAIDELPEQERLVVTLYYMDGLTQHDIADFVGVSESTVKRRLRSSRNKLKGELLTMVQENLQKQDLTSEFTDKVAFRIENLEEVPDVTYDDIGGLDKQIEKVREAIENPYLYPDEYKESRLTPPKGILLYGPPGCGKTMIAKAVANNLAEITRQTTGREDIESYFLNVKGTELLNKDVDETKRRIREVFERANEKASEGVPVIIFFDEMDTILKTRGLGISSDMESTLVGQFLVEIDGMVDPRRFIIIGASNRQELLDPAILRPGRLDKKIQINRPDKRNAEDIFKKYLTEELPIAQSEIDSASGDKTEAVKSMIERAVEEMYAEEDEKKFPEVANGRGGTPLIYFKDFASGAMIRNVVFRAKASALKRFTSGGEKGITYADLSDAIRAEYTRISEERLGACDLIPI